MPIEVQVYKPVCVSFFFFNPFFLLTRMMYIVPTYFFLLKKKQVPLFLAASMSRALQLCRTIEAREVSSFWSSCKVEVDSWLVSANCEEIC